METEYVGLDTVHKQWITIEPITLIGNPLGIELTSSRGHRWVDGSKTIFIIELVINTTGLYATRSDDDKLTMTFTANLAINNPVTVFTMAPAVKNGETIYSSILIEMAQETITLRAFPFQGLTEYTVKFQGHYRTLTV